MPPHRLEPPYRFLVDECLGQKVIREAIEDVLEEGEQVVPFSSVCDLATLDEVWLRRAGAKGLVVITKDARFRHRPNEHKALVEASTAVFVIGSRAGATVGRQLARAVPTMRRVLRGHPIPLVGRVLDNGSIALFISGGDRVQKTIKLPAGSPR